jgi:hypothetical protein
MNLARQRVLGVLIAVVLWTASPLIACLPGPGQRPGAMANSDCCQAMAMPDCGRPMMDNSCCELAPSQSNLALITSYTLPHDQQLAIVANEIYLPLPIAPDAAQASYGDTPPPDPSPGGLSVLRI